VEQEHTLVYLLLFNVQSAIVSVVGDDFPQEYLDLLTSRNIDISGLE
jgi:sugar/nucleoside kinase (ribokinase family)